MKSWGIILSIAAACCALSLGPPCFAEQRAFVVGINSYAAMPPLRTAINDATAISEALSALGYVVTTVKDPGQAEFSENWRMFRNSLKVGDAAAFYFAGHGLQIDGANYLLLKDSPGPDGGEKGVLDTAVDFFEVMQQLELRGVTASLYILDACRNNPISDTRVNADKRAAWPGSKVFTAPSSCILPDQTKKLSTICVTRSVRPIRCTFAAYFRCWPAPT